METIKLHKLEGIARKSGIDGNDCSWIEFEVDHFAEQTPGTCTICGEKIESGWLCLDGGEEVCSEHIRYAHDSNGKLSL